MKSQHTEKEIKIKTPYGIKNWSYIKKLMDLDTQVINSHDKLVEALKFIASQQDEAGNWAVEIAKIAIAKAEDAL